jgi:hypothetical protein
MVFLGATIPAVGTAAALAARWTAGAVVRQEALRLAAQTLDSLAAVAAPVAGAGVAGGLRVRWWPDAAGDPGRITVEVSDPSGARLASLTGLHHPTLPVLPDDGTPAPPVSP